MESCRSGLLALLLACSVVRPDETAAQAPDPPAAPPIAPFADVPAGPLAPGCTVADFTERAANDQLKAALRYDIWGQAGIVQVPAFQIGKHEVTNAQWKLYFDRRFRVEHKTTGEETLKDIARQHVKFRGQPVETEWKAIYAFNYEAIVKALKEADAKAAEERRKAEAEGKKQEGEAKKPLWQPNWTEVAPGVPGQAGVESVLLPKDLKLDLYSRVTPKHWYGWCKLADLQAGQEYCDIRKPPQEAFVVPDGGIFAEQVKPLRDKDFARHPIRDVAPVDILEFAEWAGCHLPSEYEWERSVRSDRPNTDQQPFPGKWDRQKQTDYFVYADNPLVAKQGLAPLPVDDARVEKGDSVPYGLRHPLGNVWELTRTFFDMHPRVVPQPPPHERGLFNYTLIAKGGSWGDGWVLMQVSSRTGEIGNAELDLKEQNRADSLGFRLVRHPAPGQDLLRHSILRLAYNEGRGVWARPYPHAYSLARMAGVERVHIVDAGPPYLHVQEKAAAIAFAPVWYPGGWDPQQDPGMDEGFRNKSKNEWARGAATGRAFTILGVLRCDVPILGGVRLAPNDAKKLFQDRADYEKALKEKKKYDQKKKKNDPPFPMPPEPPQPDRYEKDTIKNMDAGAGLWREGEIPPGEWLVVYWYEHLALINKAHMVDAILMFDDPRKGIERLRTPAGPAAVRPAADGKSFTLEFTVDEQLDSKKPQAPPGEEHSNEWALCEVMEGWLGRRPARASWRFTITVPVKEGALKAHGW